MQILSLKKRKIIVALLSVLTTAAVLGVFYWRCGIYFDINDERYMIHILSGSMTGTPNPHVIYMNYILGIIFSGLYSVTTQVPWLGIFYVVCYFISFWAIMYALMMKGKTFVGTVINWFLGVMFICMNLYIFCQLQYTTLAGVLAVTGYFLILLDRKKNIGYFAIFQILAIFIRDQSMMLVQPLGMVMLVCVIFCEFAEHRKKWKKISIELLKYLGIVCGVFAIAFIGDYIIGDYGSKEWKEYAEYTDLNTDLFDYYGKPYDEEILQILQKHNVTPADYICFSNDWMCMSELENECLDEIRDYAKDNYEQLRQSNMGAIFQNTILQCMGKSGFGKSLTAYDIYWLCLLVFVSVLIILKKKYGYFLWVLLVEVTKFVLMFYLVYRGRYPLRVTNILMFSELLFLIYLIQRIGLEIKGRVWKKIVLLGCTAILLKEIVSGGMFVYWSVRTNNMIKSNYTTSINELYDYWNQEEYGYLVDTGILVHYTGDVFDTKWHNRQAFLWCGGWYYNSPVTDRAEEEYLTKYAGKLRTVVRVEENGTGTHMLERLRECGMIPELIDVIQVSNGEKYEIYQLIQ